MLEVTDLTVAYGEAVAVRDVSLRVADGTVVALIGANGAGKTTLVTAIMGMVASRAGTVRVDGQDVSEMGPADMPAVGVALVPEGRRLFADMTVADNLAMGAFHPSVRDGAEARLEEVMALFPTLARRARQVAGTLSGGEQQMVALGRAMMADPRLLLLDEPSLGLAPIIVDQVFGMIERVRGEGVSVLLAEQNSYRALSTASHGYVLDDGHVVMDGAAEDLLSADEVREAYLGGE